MPHEFTNADSLPINAGDPSVVESTLQVVGLSERIFDVNVSLDITHTWTDDLRVTLIAPSGDTVLLVSGEGANGHDFEATRFDDSATDSIEGAQAPFRGTFKPEENLSKLNGQNPNGTWTLRVEDREPEDGGSLNRWTLSVETSDSVFVNSNPITIPSGPPSTVVASVAATGQGGLVVDNVEVTVRLKHSWVSDLRLVLVAPDGTDVLLFDQRGGNGADLSATFADDATKGLTEGAAPFAGRYRPEEPLSLLRERLAGGVWSLRVEDNETEDGGVLELFQLTLLAKMAEPRTHSNFSIVLRFNGGLTASQRSVFELAKARWQEIIVGDLPSAQVDGEEIDDVLIEASGQVIDGASGTLGQASPTVVRTDSLIPCKGVMSFDVADLETMEADGSLVDVIIHEMGHVLGLGTVWHDQGLVTGATTNNPEFTGARARSAYAALRGDGQDRNVPLANTGGAGTAEGHWREAVFHNELMTGFIDPGTNPLSRLTVAALQDLGYEVNVNASDEYTLPGEAGPSLRRSTARRFVCPTKGGPRGPVRKVPARNT